MTDVEEERTPGDPRFVEALPIAERAAAFRLALEDLQRRLGLPGG